MIVDVTSARGVVPAFPLLEPTEVMMNDEDGMMDKDAIHPSSFT